MLLPSSQTTLPRLPSPSALRFSSFAFFANFRRNEYRRIDILRDYKELPWTQQTALLCSIVLGRLFVTNDTFSDILMRTLFLVVGSIRIILVYANKAADEFLEQKSKNCCDKGKLES
jgi:hypothetical protein